MKKIHEAICAEGMAKSMKKHTLLALIVFVVILGACGGTESNGTESGTTGSEPGNESNGVVAEITPPERDLGGKQINIVTWWEENCTATAEPVTAAMRARWDDRRAMEQRYNFRIAYIRYGSWQDVRDAVGQEILAGNRNYQVWTVEPSWFATHQNAGLFAPIPLEYFNDDRGVEWNHGLIEMLTHDGMAYGWSSGMGFAGGVYFNMRLFEEAGFDRDLPFTKQRENNWTWETFTNTARELSIDEDGDGIINTWAITTFNADFLGRALASNNAAYARLDPETGLFVNATGEDAFRETIDWMVYLRDARLAMHEDEVGGDWNVFIEMFNTGQGAIRAASYYVAGNIFPELADDWGFVAFPRGPRSDYHFSWVPQNPNVIPHFYNSEEVSDILFAISLWERELEDDHPDDWKDEAFIDQRDPRSVEETMVNFTRNADLQVMAAHFFMPGLGDTLNDNFAFRIWSPMNHDASVIIEEAQLVWEAFLDRVNNL
ncbi:MAG: extracellular solute-binding protein [Defluviitaleaceae bacterium]|nr:extracellular solute-binding protein [Defluviitaleaceae bacterium]